MSDHTPISTSAATPEFRAAQRWNIVWVVPILALLIGGWMIYRSLSTQGPVAQIHFDTADGIATGKTEVRCRSVRVGVVKNVKLAADLKSVLIYLELDPDSGNLLRKGTRFWVVRPRVSATDVSGLGTLLTGAYIELDPGSMDTPSETRFQGLETPPATNRNIPGRRLTLTAEQAGSLVAGSPIYYRGFEVGRIENRTLDRDGQRVSYDAFIREEYSNLVTANTRFWNTSGIDISAGTEGFKLRTPSFQAMFSGGASFGIPAGMPPGNAVADGCSYTLFVNEDAASSSTFNPTMKFILLFDQSVRGLGKGAPVEFRGIPVGRVADISFDYLQAADDSRIPVLIEIDPSVLRREAADKLKNPDEQFLTTAVKRGLRASLKPGSLLTGALFVDLDYYKDPRPAALTKIGELPCLPTVASGLAQLTAILDKIQSLPVDDTLRKVGNAADTVADARIALKEIQEAAAEYKKLPKDLSKTLAALEKSVSSVGPEGAMQGDLLLTLDELRASLRSLKALTTAIDEKPNSILFGRDSSGNPIPKAPKISR